MKNRVIENYCKTNGMLAHGNFMYGIKDGYYVVTQYIMQGYVTAFEVCIPLVNLQNEDREEIKRFVKENKKSLKMLSVEFRQNIAAVRMNAIPNPKKPHYENMLEGLINFYKMKGFVSGCAVTNATENIKFTLYKGSVIPVSEEVAAKFDVVSTQMDAENEEKGYFTGAIGACVGGLIGVIPWILFGLLGYVTSISALVMGWLIKIGYEKTGGKKGGAQMAILIIALVVFTYIGIIALETVFVIQMFMQEGFQAADLRIFAIFADIFVYPFMGGSEMWAGILQGYFYAALGGFIFLRNAANNKGFSAGGQINTRLAQPNTDFGV